MDNSLLHSIFDVPEFESFDLQDNDWNGAIGFIIDSVIKVTKFSNSDLFKS